MALNRKAWYKAMLRRPEWKELRLRVLERDGFECQRCFVSPPAILQVHHLEYHGIWPWDTPLEFLQTLCKSCHFKEHFAVSL